MSNLLFIAVLVILATLFVSGVFVGVNGWDKPAGKMIAIGSGVLLFGLILFASLVLLIVVSGWAGHPF